MGRRWKILLFLVVPLAIAGFVGFKLLSRGPSPLSVFVEKIQQRDLEAIVRESGKVRAKTSVLLSANTLGQVKDVPVHEGDVVTTGQVLIQIDPTPFETAIERADVAVRDAEKRLEIAKTQLERTRKKLDREKALGVSGTQEKIDELTSDLAVQKNEVEAAELRVVSEKAALESARHELTKVRITSPIDGVVLRINIGKGQNTVMGAMNSAGTELMTIADLSVLQVELEVGEAAILDVHAGQEARVAIDALPNRKLKGKVTEVGTSPVSPPAGQQDRGVSFRVIITLDEVVEGVRPGFSASVEIVTATRTKALAVPIRAVVARELPVDDKEQVITATPVPAGTKKKLFEGVMRMRDGKAQFQAIKVGVTGKEHFEVLEGIVEGDEVVTGPHKTLRDLKDGALLQGKAEE